MDNNGSEITVESPKFVELPVIKDDKDDAPIPPVSNNTASDSGDRATIIDPKNAQLQTDKGWFFCVFMMTMTYASIFFIFLISSMFATDYSSNVEYYCDSVIYCASTHNSNCCSANSTAVYCYQGSLSAPCVDIFAAHMFIQKYLDRENFTKIWYGLFFAISTLLCLGSAFCTESIQREQQKRNMDKTARNTSV